MSIPSEIAVYQNYPITIFYRLPFQTGLMGIPVNHTILFFKVDF